MIDSQGLEVYVDILHTNNSYIAHGYRLNLLKAPALFRASDVLTALPTTAMHPRTERSI